MLGYERSYPSTSFHDFTLDCDEEPAKFCRRMKNTVFRAAYTDDLQVLAASGRASRFYRVLQPQGSYAEAKPHPLCDTFGKTNRACRVDFFRAILGSHPLCSPAGLNNPVPVRCPQCGCAYGRRRPLTHALFYCPAWHAERLPWARNIISIISENMIHGSDLYLKGLFTSAIQAPYTPSQHIEHISFGGDLSTRIYEDMSTRLIWKGLGGYEDRGKERDTCLLKERAMLICLQTAQLIHIIRSEIFSPNNECGADTCSTT